jgi:hypothetical protein
MHLRLMCAEGLALRVDGALRCSALRLGAVVGGCRAQSLFGQPPLHEKRSTSQPVRSAVPLPAARTSAALARCIGPYHATSRRAPAAPLRWLYVVRPRDACRAFLQRVRCLPYASALGVLRPAPPRAPSPRGAARAARAASRGSRARRRRRLRRRRRCEARRCRADVRTENWRAGTPACAWARTTGGPLYSATQPVLAGGSSGGGSCDFWRLSRSGAAVGTGALSKHSTSTWGVKAARS